MMSIRMRNFISFLFLLKRSRFNLLEGIMMVCEEWFLFT